MIDARWRPSPSPERLSLSLGSWEKTIGEHIDPPPDPPPEPPDPFPSTKPRLAAKSASLLSPVTLPIARFRTHPPTSSPAVKRLGTLVTAFWAPYFGISLIARQKRALSFCKSPTRSDGSLALFPLPTDEPKPAHCDEPPDPLGGDPGGLTQATFPAPISSAKCARRPRYTPRFHGSASSPSSSRIPVQVNACSGFGVL